VFGFEHTTYGSESQCATHYTTVPHCYSYIITYIWWGTVKQWTRYSLISHSPCINTITVDQTSVAIWPLLANMTPTISSSYSQEPSVLSRPASRMRRIIKLLYTDLDGCDGRSTFPRIIYQSINSVSSFYLPNETNASMQVETIFNCVFRWLLTSKAIRSTDALSRGTSVKNDDLRADHIAG